MPSRIGASPNSNTLDTSATNIWFKFAGDRFRVYSGAADPALGEVPENQWIVYYNTNLAELRIWTNIAGTLKKSAAFT